jgi:hypothetical protein
VIDHLPSKYETLNSTTSARKKKRERERERKKKPASIIELEFSWLFL